MNQACIEKCYGNMVIQFINLCFINIGRLLETTRYS